MRIGELAHRSGLTTKTLRFYEQAGVLAQPARRPSGYRDYDATALTRLGFIRAAQSAGLTLTEIRDIIAIRDSHAAPCNHVIALLDRHLHDLQERIRELTAMRDEVRRLRRRADTLDPAKCGDDDICHVIPSFVGGDRPGGHERALVSTARSSLASASAGAMPKSAATRVASDSASS